MHCAIHAMRCCAHRTHAPLCHILPDLRKCCSAHSCHGCCALPHRPAIALIRSLRDEPIRLRHVVYTRTCLLRFPTRRFHNSDIRRLFRLCAAQRMLMRGTSDPPVPRPPPPILSYPILSYPNLIRSDSEPIPAVHVRETPQNRRPACTSPHRRNRALLAWAVSCA